MYEGCFEISDIMSHAFKLCVGHFHVVSDIYLAWYKHNILSHKVKLFSVMFFLFFKWS